MALKQLDQISFKQLLRPGGLYLLTVIDSDNEATNFIGDAASIRQNLFDEFDFDGFTEENDLQDQSEIERHREFLGMLDGTRDQLDGPEDLRPFLYKLK